MSVWKTIRDAVSGDPHRDYTEGPLGRAIFMLAVPMVLETMMESLFAVVDMYWVAHLGPDAATTVGLTESLLFILFAVALGLSIATGATIGRRIGEKNAEGAGEAAMQSLLLGLGIAVVLGGVGSSFAPQLLHAMGASDAIVASGSGYARAIYGGSGTVVLLFLLNSAFRGAGDAAIAMRVLWTANWINIFLNPCLIYGLGPFPKMGVTGSGVGTTIGRGCGVLLQLYFLSSGKSRVRIDFSKLRVIPDLMMKMLKLSFGGMVQYFVGVASWIALVRMNATFGTTSVAGYTIALRVIMFALLPSWGLASAAATMVGQSLGAKKPDRAEQAVWKAGKYNMVLLSSLGVVFFALARPVSRIFTDDEAVADMAVLTLRTVACGYPFYAWGMVIAQAFNGAGDTRTPTLLNLVCFWGWQIPLAALLAFTFGWGPFGIYVAIGVAQSTLAPLGVIWFRKGRWKGLQV